MIQSVIDALEALAPPVLQESFDNCGLLVGNPGKACTGVLCTLDATEEVVREARALGCNLVVTYHPIIFSGLKRLTGATYVERAVMEAIRGDVAIYAIHTNLDSIRDGVNGKIAGLLELKDLEPLIPKAGLLRKVFVFVPHSHADAVRTALFEAGAGHIGAYSHCSFNTEGKGTYLPGKGAQPYLGKVGKLHEEPEIRIEAVFPVYREKAILTAMRKAHPYEEVAYDLVTLSNALPGTGTGWIGRLALPMTEAALLERLKAVFQLQVIRHSPLLGKPVRSVAVCGGAGSFLTPAAIAAGADWLITADVKYHEFFGAGGKLVLADIGHFESEQFTVGLLAEILREKFPNFALLNSKTRTNPVHYFI